MKIPIAVVIVNRRILVLHRPVECTVLFGQAVKSALQFEATQHMIGIGTARAGWMRDECSDPGKPLVPERFQGQPEYVTDRKAERE